MPIRAQTGRLAVISGRESNRWPDGYHCWISWGGTAKDSSIHTCSAIKSRKNPQPAVGEHR
jgi:hypothetical protein